jgi:hypothetical protein
MSAKPKPVETTEIETVLADISKSAAPMVARLPSHRDALDLARKALESERYELISRRDLMRRQVEAVEQGYALHIQDIDDCLSLYDAGLNSLPVVAP